MGTILIVLIVGFICYKLLWPLVRTFWGGYKVYRKWKKMAQEAYNASASQTPPPKPHRKKKIDPAVGEYVAFEELQAQTYAEAKTFEDGHTEVRIESQIEDAVWEELPPKS